MVLRGGGYPLAHVTDIAWDIYMGTRTIMYKRFGAQMENDYFYSVITFVEDIDVCDILCVSDVSPPPPKVLHSNRGCVTPKEVNETLNYRTIS